jgi:hypothetical protein
MNGSLLRTPGKTLRPAHRPLGRKTMTRCKGTFGSRFAVVAVVTCCVSVGVSRAEAQGLGIPGVGVPGAGMGSPAMNLPQRNRPQMGSAAGPPGQLNPPLGANSGRPGQVAASGGNRGPSNVQAFVGAPRSASALSMQARGPANIRNSEGLVRQNQTRGANVPGVNARRGR